MKNKKTNILFVLFASLLFVVGCSSKPSGGSGEGDNDGTIIYNDYYDHNNVYHWRESTDGEEKTDYAEHDFELVQETPATYQQQGKRTYRCKVCNYRKVEAISKLVHQYDESFTYDEHGHWRVCVDEGYEGLKTDYSTHSYVSETVQEADYDKELITKYTCSVCGYHYELTGECLHHNYDEEYTADETGHWHACLDEGYEESKDDFEEHTFNEEVLEEPTFEEKGSTKYTCEVCGFSYTIDTDEQKHNFSNEFEHDENYHWHLCVDKGYETITDEKVEHEFEEEVVDPTYDNDGYTLYTCSECGYQYTDNTVEHLEHHYSEEYEHDNYRHWKVCIDEGYEDLKFGVEMHHYSKEVTEPTFTEYGYTVYTCEDCGFSFTQDGHSYKPHSYSEEYESSSEGHWHSCIDEGYEELTTDIEEHVLGNWQVETYPTSTEEGSAFRACKYCGYHLETISIPTNTAYLPEHFSYSTYYPGEGDPYVSIFGLNLSDASMVIIPEEIGDIPVTSISSYALCDRSFQRIIIPETITYIGNNALQNCNYLTEICFPESLKQLNQYVLSYCDSITKIEIPGIERMEYYSIAYCGHLIDLYLPECLSYINQNVLYGLDDLENIYTDKNSQYFTSLDGVLYSKDLSTLVKYPCKNSNPCLYYGEEVKSVYSGNTLSSCDKITEVDLGMNNYFPSEVLNLTNLCNVVINEDNTAFKTRQNGRVLLNYDEDYLYFVSRDYENSFTIPSTVTGINERALYNCENITSVSMNNNVTYIGNYAFSYCSSLTSITLSNSLTQLNWGIFAYCSSLSSITIPNSVTYISGYAFQYCTSLMSITIPNTITEIGYGVFYGCESLVDVALSNQLETIPDYAFCNCYSLESIYIPESVRYIQYAAFAYCTSLTLLDIPNTVEYINNYVIESYSSPTISIVIGPTVTSMSSYSICHYNGSTNIFFKGTQSDWGNYSNSYYLTYALSSYTIYYYSEYQPTSSGNYWRYVNGVPEIWII